MPLKERFTHLLRWFTYSGAYLLRCIKKDYFFQSEKLSLSKIHWQCILTVCISLDTYERDVYRVRMYRAEKKISFLKWLYTFSHINDFYKYINKTHKKNMVWHSHNFLLPCIIVEKYFINCITFIFNLYFISFVVNELPAFIIIIYSFWT